jgi:hypothetical protein
VLAQTGLKRFRQFRGPENVGKRMILMAAKWRKEVWRGDCFLCIDQKHSEMFWSQWEKVPILWLCGSHRLDDSAEIRIMR